MIQLRTLGDAYVAHDHEIIQTLVARPKLFALLTYLVMDAAPGFHQRDTLLALFWPASDESHARNSLRQSLHVLRGSLGPEVLVSRGRTLVGVNRARVDCDAVAFETALKERRSLDALNLYQGSFLSGFHARDAWGFNDWADGESERLRTLAGDAARKCAEDADAEGRVHDAIREWRRVRRFEPVNEAVLKRFLAALLKAGRLEEASWHCHRFVHQQFKLGFPPSEEVLRLMRSRFGSGEPPSTLDGPSENSAEWYPQP